MKEPLRVHIDGGARGNPGPAGFGVHVADASGETVAELYGFLGRATNNVAEYAACVAALEWATANKVGDLSLFSDSQLLVRQLQGRYKVRNAGLQPLHARCRRLMAGISSLHLSHVRREENKEADALANRAMDEGDGNIPSPL
jgi:probable phosphoglycerate mutase